MATHASPTTVWIMAGEPSGDLYGARLANALRDARPETIVKGMGSAGMRAAGVELLADSTNLAVMGFVEVLKHLRTFRRVFRELVERAERERPDVVVLIDYPGFNLRFAKKLHALGIRVVYYISPQVWAWGKRRIPELARVVDRMLVIFPFEVDVYAGTGLDVQFVGHPLLEIMADNRDRNLVRDPHTVLLLPGSRMNEIKGLMPVMARTAAWLHVRNPNLRFVVAAPSQEIATAAEEAIAAVPARMRDGLRITCEVGQTRQWMQRAAAGIAASGTVTMEAAILGLPLVVAYRVNPLTYGIARALVKIPYFTIVNLVADSLVYEEFLQKAVTPENLGGALQAILPGGKRVAEVRQGMDRAIAAVSGEGHVCKRAATAVLQVADKADHSSQRGARP